MSPPIQRSVGLLPQTVQSAPSSFAAGASRFQRGHASTREKICHPFAPADQVKGSLAMIHELEGMLSEITGFAGVMLASRMSLGDPKTSVGLELGVISACVLGGGSLTGGVATISGVLVGVLIMGSVQDAMSLLNVPTFSQYLIRGGILLLAVLFDQFRRSRRVV